MPTSVQAIRGSHAELTMIYLPEHSYSFIKDGREVKVTCVWSEFNVTFRKCSTCGFIQVNYYLTIDNFERLQHRYYESPFKCSTCRLAAVRTESSILDNYVANPISYAELDTRITTDLNDVISAYNPDAETGSVNDSSNHNPSSVDVPPLTSPSSRPMTGLSNPTGRRSIFREYLNSYNISYEGSLSNRWRSIAVHADSIRPNGSEIS